MWRLAGPKMGAAVPGEAWELKGWGWPCTVWREVVGWEESDQGKASVCQELTEE